MLLNSDGTHEAEWIGYMWMHGCEVDKMANGFVKLVRGHIAIMAWIPSPLMMHPSCR